LWNQTPKIFNIFGVFFIEALMSPYELKWIDVDKYLQVDDRLIFALGAEEAWEVYGDGLF